MTILQNVLHPSEQTCPDEAMYYHMDGGVRTYNGYFNLFSAGKWRSYTKISRVFLALSVSGEGRVRIFTEDGPASGLVTVGRADPGAGKGPASGLVTVGRADPGAEAGRTRIELPYQTGARFIWFSWEPVQAEARILHAAYITKDAPLHPVRLAADICTYRREACVRRNIALLRERILDDPSSPLYGKLDIFVADNGRTLNSDLTEERLDARRQESSAAVSGQPTMSDAAISGQPVDHVFVFPNANTGGAGGFTRGMLEVLRRKKEKGYTHIILMDDDVLIEPDALVRTHGLLSYIREEYAKACISGDFLDLGRKWMQFEAGGVYHRGQMERLGYGVDLRDFSSVLENEAPSRSDEAPSRSDEALSRSDEAPSRSDFAGWWYACYPLTVVRRDNLPMPYFIHGDDMEYGLRNRNGILTLNGICIWHENADMKHSQAMKYYDYRNRLITNALHLPPDPKSDAGEICREVLYRALQEQYETADAALLAVQDYLRGPSCLLSAGHGEAGERLKKGAGSFLPFEQVTDDPRVLDSLRRYAKLCREGRQEESGVSKAAYRYTMNGWILPARKREEGEAVCCSVFSTDMRELYRSDEAYLVDPYQEKARRVKRDYRKMAHCIRACIRIRAMLSSGNARAAESYRKNREKLTSAAFWERFLEADRG